MKKHVKPATQVKRMSPSVEAPYVLVPDTPPASLPPGSQHDIAFAVSYLLTVSPYMHIT